MQIENVTVNKHEKITGDYRLLEFHSKKIAPQVKPGQFVHLRVPGTHELVLRRPFSVYKTGKRRLAILYKIIGAGTALLAELKRGDKVNIIGPLGNGFPMPSAEIYPLFVAGGYGSAALYLLAEKMKQKGVLFVGGKTRNDILCAGDFRKIGWQVVMATEDGSAGRKGLVTEVLMKWVKNSGKVGREPPWPSSGRPAPPEKNKNGGAGPHTPYLGTSQPEIFSCGPMGMLKAVSDIAIKFGWPAWLSLDKNMGCGVGACLACVQKVKDKNGGWKWARVCTEGPVFECRRIIWE